MTASNLRKFAFMQAVRLLELGAIGGFAPKDRENGVFSAAERIVAFLGDDAVRAGGGPVVGQEAGMDTMREGAAADWAEMSDGARCNSIMDELVRVVSSAGTLPPHAQAVVLTLRVEKPIAAEIFHALMCQRDRHCARMQEFLAWNPDEDERLRVLDGAIRLVQSQLFGPSPL